MSKNIKVFLVVVVCIGILTGGIFSYKKYLDNKEKEQVKTSVKETDNNETTNNGSSQDTKYKVEKIQSEKYISELSEDKYTIKEDTNNSLVTIYKKDTKELVKEYKFSYNEGCYYSKIYYDGKILGYIESHSDGNTKICTYLNDCFETDYEVIGDSIRLGCDMDFYTNNKDAIIVRKDNKSALLSLRTGKLIGDFVYEELYGISNKQYIAIKNNKAGIVDENYKVLVDFAYDLIDDYENYYVISKDGKLAIMNKDLKLITDFSIVANFKPEDYSYTPCCGYENPLYAIKVEDNYVLNTHNADYWHNTLNEQNAYVYFIKANGSYEKINNAWNLIKLNDSLFYITDANKNSTFYDNNFNKLYVINDSSFEIVFPNIMKSGLGENSKFYDITNGKEITSLLKYDFYNISLEYSKVESVGGSISWEYNLYVDGNLFLKDISNVKFNKDGSFYFSDYENDIEYVYNLQKIN